MKASWQSFRNLLKERPQTELSSAETSAEKIAAKDVLENKLKSGGDGYDPLTGLPLKGVFLEQVARAIKLAKRKNCYTGIVNIGLNDIKRVNDIFGPRFADVLIRQAAFRLYAAVRTTDSLARVGGVNFAVALEPFDAIEDALNMAQRMLDILGETFSLIELAQDHISLSANAGISIYPKHGLTADDIFHHSGVALSEAEASGPNKIELFSPERREESRVRLELEWMLRRALDKHEFDLSYQPEIDLRQSRILRREALLRWTPAQGESIPPSSFIPIAEQTGLIVRLGTWVLDEACRKADEWQHGPDKGVGVAVNVSAVQLARPDFAATVESALTRAGLPGDLLELELTESALMSQFEKSVQEIQRLRQSGVSVVIDDFGVGYSSLSYLKELPVSGVKLDRSFLRDLERNPNSLPILRSIVSLAHGLNMRVTVEGVETAEHLSAVKQLGVDAAQGFFLGMPESYSAEHRIVKSAR